ncbi:hypothetical protein FZ934_22465 (plasmid) [Rhizobium grahamii]|uniref:Uncharacterized protein n=1 Tax=Rhizobium grahamii TaxID=1120045 RepID=A0A5Q0CAY3_9HYPH|nr:MULTISPECIES: hypothetical protein [Rhizobium]QFY63078.1 hypothetical protein FZ934_22465 [Rhizobium grahamii]QRM52159.1 hypothetical protein F3Y33_23190 [Rhizobium sp. BG6]
MEQPRDIPVLVNVVIGALSGYASAEITLMCPLSGPLYAGVVFLLILLMTSFAIKTMKQFWQ